MISFFKNSIIFLKLETERSFFVNKILESYFSVADMIAETFGSNCEVVVHDLTHPQSSVVHVANSQVTGRTPGQSFDHLIPQVLLNKRFSNDRVSNYVFESEGKKIKSSSVLIRDESDCVIGMLCINIDVSIQEQMYHMLAEFLPDTAEAVSEPDPSSSESAAEIKEINAIIDELIDNIIGNNDPSGFKKKDNLEIIEFMDKKGVFLVKGAVEKIADRLNVSRVTIYNYLDEIRSKNNSSI